MVQRERDLDQSCGASGRLSVTDLRLHRTERAPRMAVLFRRPEDRCEPACLSGITGLRRRAVRLDQLDRSRAVVGFLICSAKCLGLTFGPRRVDTGALSVRRRTEPTNDRIDLVTVALSIFEAAQREHAHTFTDERTISFLGERPAIPSRGERGRLREAHVHQDVVEGVDTPRDHHVTVTQIQFVQSRLQRGDRARTRRVGDKVRAAEIESVRDPPSDHVTEQSRKRAFLPRLVVVFDPLDDLLNPAFRQPGLAQRIPPERVVQPGAHLHNELRRRRYAQDHAGATQVRIIREFPRIDKNPLRCDQGEELGSVGRRDRRWRHPELHRIERHRVEVSTPLRVRHIRSSRVRIVVVLDQPGVRRYVSQAVSRGNDIAPEADQVLTPCEQGAHSDDSNRRGGGHLLSQRRGRGEYVRSAAPRGTPAKRNW